jgi:hypothetical protein
METLRVILNIAAEAVLPGGIGWPLRSEAGLFGLKVTADAPQSALVQLPPWRRLHKPQDNAAGW